jgi:Fe2+ or Zn2+ uptake regulation protein
MQSASDVLDSFRKNSKKITTTRKTIVKMFVGKHNLLTANQIQQKLRQKGLNLNKTSVYRELQFLLDSKILKKILISPGVVHYESALSNHHHHIVCNSCGNVEEVDTRDIEKSMVGVEKNISRGGFKVLDHHLEFYGLCGVCNKENITRPNELKF